MTSSSSNFLTLFNGQTTNATGSSVVYRGRSQLALLYIGGSSIGSGTLKIQIKPIYDGKDAPTLGFIDLSGADALTSLQGKLISIPAFCEIRAVLSGSTSANLDVGIFFQ